MGVYKEGKNWKVQVYYKDWQGNRKRKQKREFRTKGEAKEWERDFLQQQSQGVDIEFGNFLEIYYKDMDVRFRENTMYTKRYIIDLKIKPYFEKKILSEITVADVRAWQNELLTYKDKNGKGYSPTYLKTVNCQLTAIFNYTIRYYNLQDNPCRKAGAIGKSKGEPKDFWMQEEFNDFLETVSDKPETRMAFLLLYWTGMCIGELLALTYHDINLEEKTISINKSYQRLKGKDMITQPKTPKSIRVITMPDFLAEEFREYCSHLYGIMKKERLFRFTKLHMEHCMAIIIGHSQFERIPISDERQEAMLRKQIDDLEMAIQSARYEQDDLKRKLMEKGVPEKEISFIHDANTEAKKTELFGKVKSGQVRFLIGSTAKMGAGTNVQDRLIALHHLDIGWKPSDLEQREGRIIRQGNHNKKVHIFRYVTESTFDSYKADIAHFSEHKITDPEQFSMEISGKVFTEKKEAGAALLAVCKDIKAVDAAMDIGNYQGYM